MVYALNSVDTRSTMNRIDERLEGNMKLIFVYNADSGKLNAWFDIAHKIIKPETYQCSLCALTHDTFSEKKAWQEFRERTNIEMEFLHRDEFEKQYKMSFNYPVVLRQTDALKELISADELGQAKNVEELMQMVEDKSKKIPR